MDAIIFFSKKRDLRQWKLSFIRMEDYLLLKAEADVERSRWFGESLPEVPEPPEEPADGGWLKRRWRRRAARKEYERRRQEYEQAYLEQEACVRRMARELMDAAERAGAMGELFCVYTGELRFLADRDSPTGQMWQQYWNIPEFREYFLFRWMKPLLPEAVGPHFVLLGTSPDVPLLLGHCARRMKSLHWYLRAEDCTEETEELAEDFYLEYGLAIALHPLGNRHPFRSLRLHYSEPVCVLDFTEEEKFFAGELAKDSVWLDFASVEEKGRRLGRLFPGVGYDSLLLRWRRCGREVTVQPYGANCCKTCGSGQTHGFS